MSIEAPIGAPSISAPSFASISEAGMFSVGNTPSLSSSFGETGGKSLGENPFSRTVELNVQAPQIFEKTVPGNLAFTNTEIFAQSSLLSPNIQVPDSPSLDEILGAKPLGTIGEPVLDQVEPDFSFAESESIAQKIQIPEVMPDTAPENAQTVQLLEMYMEKYGIETGNDPNQELDTASYAEINSDLRQAQKVISALVSAGIDPKKAKQQILVDVHEKWQRTGLSQQIENLQKPIAREEAETEQMPSGKIVKDKPEEKFTVQKNKKEDSAVEQRMPVFEEDPNARNARELLALNALKIALEKAQIENRTATGHDVAYEIPQKQTQKVKSEIVQYPTVERKDGSYEPWRKEIAKTGPINSIEKGLVSIKQALDDNRAVRGRDFVTTIEAEPKEIRKVLGDSQPFESLTTSQEIIIFSRLKV